MQTPLHAADILGRNFSEQHTCISAAAGSRKKTRELTTNICIWREQVSQAQSLSTRNTWLLLLLEVYYGIVVRASIEGMHWFYDSWKEGFVLIDRDLTLPVISEQPPCVQTNHRSSEKLLLYPIELIPLIIPLSETCILFHLCLCPPQNKHLVTCASGLMAC